MMFEHAEDEQLQPAAPAKKRQLLPYYILAGLFVIGLIVYFLIPLKP